MTLSPSVGATSRLLSTAFSTGLAMLAGLALATETTAQGLAKVGPVSAQNGYPLFYEDANGLRLGLCTDPNLCFFVTPNPALPTVFPTNFPDESFYFAATASMTGPSATAFILCGLEAAFANGPLVPGDQVVFTRVRIRLTGLVDGASYTITYPYGQATYIAGVDGPLPGTINVTRDVGIGSPGQFQLALNGGVGPFVTTLGFLSPGIPGAFIGDGATEVQIQGSPLGTNFFRVDGPNADVLFPANVRGLNRAQMDNFVVMGQVATQSGAAIDKAVLSRTATSTSLNVWASTATGQSLSASIAGGLPQAMVPGTNGQYFTRLELGAGAIAPTSVIVTNATDFPPTSFTLNVITDDVQVNSAIYTVNGDLIVTAVSTDQVNSPVLTASVPGYPAAALISTGAGAATGGLALPLGAIPPKTVSVSSAAGGVSVTNVLVEGNGAPIGGGIPVVANAGPDLQTNANTIVALSGLGSTGPIATYAWIHDAGAQILLQGADTATPFFTAPNIAAGTLLDITLTLTVADGLGAFSTDSVIVHVAGPVVLPPVLDIVTVINARYDARRNFWRANGTARLIQGQTISIYLGAIGDRSRLLQRTTVDAVGAWTFIQANGAAPFAPQAGDTTVWAESSLGGTPGSRIFQAR